MAPNILPTEPPPPPDPRGQKVKIQLFSEQYHISYQIKGDHECSNMVANVLPADPPPPDPGVGVKFSLFQNMAMLQVKLKGIRQQTSPILEMGSIGQKSTFTECGHVVYKITRNNEMQQHG